MIIDYLPFIFCIGLAGGAILAWRKSENKYQKQHDKILELKQELQGNIDGIKRIQNTNSSGKSSDKGKANVIKNIAIILDATEDKTDDDKKISKLIKREHPDIALAILAKQASPQKRDKNEAKAMFKDMKKEM